MKCQRLPCVYAVYFGPLNVCSHYARMRDLTSVHLHAGIVVLNVGHTACDQALIAGCHNQTVRRDRGHGHRGDGLRRNGHRHRFCGHTNHVCNALRILLGRPHHTHRHAPSSSPSASVPPSRRPAPLSTTQRPATHCWPHLRRSQANRRRRRPAAQADPRCADRAG